MADAAIGAEEFAALMAPLGPWPPWGTRWPIAVAVSGGADSMALVVLAAHWAAGRGLRLAALVVDHGLRPGSGPEAVATCATLDALGIEARLHRLDGLKAGPSLAERARRARYGALTDACEAIGAVDLLLGHHAGDQAETVLMRERSGSGPGGLAGMASLLETTCIRLLRPLLAVAPARLRLTLIRAGIGWIEDPSNGDERAQRTRLRQELAVDPGRHDSLIATSRCQSRRRTRRQADTTHCLAAAVELHPEGFALLPPSLLPAATLAALIRTIGGTPYQPSPRAIERLLRRPCPHTLAGTRLLAAGKLGPGWLLLRETNAIGAPVEARHNALWDSRYRLHAPANLPPGLAVTALGADRPPGHARRWPAAIMATLPAIRRDGVLLGVPHLGWVAEPALAGVRLRLQPPVPASESSLFIGA